MNQAVIDAVDEAAASGSCAKKTVGSVIVKDGEILIRGFNGRPGKNKCSDGGCPRCVATDLFDHGRGHDICSCVHAEQSTIVTAAREGIAIGGCDLYSTYQPCMTCLKLIVASGVSAVFYREPWEVPTVPEVPELADDYWDLASQLPGGMHPFPETSN